MAAPEGRDGNPMSTKQQKKQWNSSTKLNVTKKSKSLPPSTSSRTEELPADNDEPTFMEAARLLVEKAVESAVRQEEAEGAALADKESCQESTNINSTVLLGGHLPGGLDNLQAEHHDAPATSILDIDSHLERIRAEKSRRKEAIQAFYRHLEWQVQNLTAMADAVKQREAAMDAAFDQYENWIRRQRCSEP